MICLDLEKSIGKWIFVFVINLCTVQKPKLSCSFQKRLVKLPHNGHPWDQEYTWEICLHGMAGKECKNKAGTLAELST